MGTPWHHWSPVLISLAALFSKGEERRRLLWPGTNFAGSGGVGVCVAGVAGTEGVGAVCACARAQAAPLQQVPPRRTWQGGPGGDCQGTPGKIALN